MSNTDVTDFEPEFSAHVPGTTTTPEGVVNSFITIHIAKVGGGTVGSRYEGHWMYLVTTDTGVIASGDDLSTGTPVTHSEAAALVLSFLSDDEDECYVAGIAVSRCDACGAPMTDGGSCLGDGLHDEAVRHPIPQ